MEAKYLKGALLSVLVISLMVPLLIVALVSVSPASSQATCGVEVIIDPYHQMGMPCTTLTFLVIVHNTGDNVDNFILWVENDGWPMGMGNIWLEKNLLENIKPCENENTLLYVHIPDNAKPCDQKEIVVWAQSKRCSDENNYDNALVQALCEECGVEVTIEPENQSGIPCENLYYDVIVKNTGIEVDNFDLSIVPNGWPDISIDPDKLEIEPFEDNVATLVVPVPEDVPSGMGTEVVVVVESECCDAVDNDNAIALVLPSPGVSVSIKPGYNNGVPCGDLEYTVTVRNTSNFDDTYDLSWSDNAGWGNNIWLDDSSLWVMYGGEDSTTLYVHVPVGEEGCTEDNIVVTATSQNSGVENSDSCIAHVLIVHDVNVLISPGEDEGLPGESVTFTVTVKNTGNVPDNYTLGKSDTENWTLGLSKGSVGPLAPDASDNVTLEVTIHENAEDGDKDTVTVTATCQADPSVKDSDSCTAEAKVLPPGVSVKISPGEKHAENGQTVTFTVKVTNMSKNTDSYDLSISDTNGWGPTLDDDLLEDLAPDGSKTTTLRVTIPEDAEHCTRDKIIVTARSRENENSSGNDSCMAHCLVVGPPPTERGVQVTIYPSENEGVPCENVTFLVTVKNTGNVPDNFDLTVGETLNWGPTLDDNLLVVPENENRTTTLRVHIPENATPCTRDNITVIATSVSDITISDSDSCVAHVAAKPSPILLVIAGIVGVIAGVGFALYIMKWR